MDQNSAGENNSRESYLQNELRKQLLETTEYKEKYNELFKEHLKEHAELKHYKQRYYQRIWTWFFACYIGGCSFVLTREPGQSESLTGLLFNYGLFVFSGIILGLFVLFISGIFDAIVSGADPKSLLIAFVVGCLVAPVFIQLL
ncbi:hypothetical protein H6B33_16160 [Gemmiger formicilis]|uniref:hypothetical protein n=1 Tax=Gemmiger formicilis TaxID=745368 RepID=UPI0019567122|nr:hypothetical protein [Gemmiger formicilis]MBM6916912.1 hypothetical protein [Gemmiger formicilis]